MRTTRNRLQERRNAPLVPTNSAEPFNATELKTSHPAEVSKPVSHGVSGCNSRKGARISGHTVFVLSKNGKPLTPTTPAKARKLLRGKVAEPIWNKFGKFGIRMLKDVGTVTPKTVLGVDNGTKFEGYSVVVGGENNLNVMWKLPDKKKIVKKLDDRRDLRRARRQRNCRRRPARFDNRGKDGFIAPSQLVMVQSRFKAIQEFFKCYPITDVAVEDVRFNHAIHRWGKNFSTVEIGKKRIYDWIREHAVLHLYLGLDTPIIREHYGYGKSSNKGAEVFGAHCSDALSIALDVHRQERAEPGEFIVVDDTYRPVRRRLHDAQFSKGGIRYDYSTGSFKGIRKGAMCGYGQVCGGTGSMLRVRNWSNERTGKALTKIGWLSHKFKTNTQFPYNPNVKSSLEK